MPIFSQGTTAGQFEGGYQGLLQTGMLSNTGNIGKDMFWEMVGWGTAEGLAKGVAPMGVRRIPGAQKLFGAAGKIPGMSIAGSAISTYFGAQLANTAAYMPFVAADVVGQYGLQARHRRKHKAYMGNLEMYGKGFRDTRGAQTMRQSAMAMIQQSQMGVRSALGREANYLHR